MSDKYKIIDSNQMQSLTAQAKTRDRKRANLNLHTALDDSVQRFFNALEPETYVIPHRHSGSERFELFIAIKGAAAMVLFDDDGRLLERVILNSDGPVHAIEIPGDTWHTVVSLQTDTIMYESKPGPYTPVDDKDFAAWAPREGEARCKPFIEWFARGETGSLPPG